MQDPFFKARAQQHVFIGKLGTVWYYDFQIKDVKVEGNVGIIKERITYSLQPTKVSKLEFSSFKNRS